MLDFTLNAGTFRNSNGKTYRIAGRSEKEEYTFLIDDEKETVCPYVIAWGCRGNEGSWANGHYYATVEAALEDWNADYKER